MLLIALPTVDSATTMTISGADSTMVNTKFGGAGTITDVSLLSSADAAVALTISDSTGVLFSVASGNFTTRTNFKNDNAAILRNGFLGPLTVLTAGLDSGNLSVRVWVRPDPK